MKVKVYVNLCIYCTLIAASISIVTTLRNISPNSSYSLCGAWSAVQEYGDSIKQSLMALMPTKKRQSKLTKKGENHVHISNGIQNTRRKLCFYTLSFQPRSRQHTAPNTPKPPSTLV